MIRTHFTRAADRDIGERHDYYKSVSPQLGTNFLIALDRTLEMIRRFPEMYAQEFGVYRAASIGKFQDVLYYRYRKKTITVAVVIHGRRDPQILRDRLS